jgi:cytochrome b6-f complex iron-sulfur subunit
MDTVLVIAIVVLVVLAGVVLFATARRRDTRSATGFLSRETRQRDRDAVAPIERDTAAAPSGRDVERAAVLERRGAPGPGTEVAVVTTAPPTPWVPPDPEALGVTRRQFFNRGIVGLMGLGLTGFGAACLAFIWPQLSGGFGSKIRVGKVDDILAEINDTKEPKYVPEGRLYLNPYPKDSVEKAKSVYDGAVLTGMENGLVALYQKCVHLGCRVPWCTTSQWFECPCHGSQYNRVCEKKGGPAPRGLDRFGIEVANGVASVDTAIVVQGPPIGTNTTGQEAEGPHCIGQVEEH